MNSKFCDEEVRNGFLVTRQRKEVWAIELDLLSEFDRVCKKHGLRYCVGAGTLLGAVRHNGFIPWDDDIDIYMLREEFDKLMALSDEFDKPYFLQNSYTEKYLLRSFARLRNDETTGATVREIDLPQHKGIFIDIFPLDGITPNTIAGLLQRVYNKFLKNLCGCYNYSWAKNPAYNAVKKCKQSIYKIITAVFVRNKMAVYHRFENNLKRYSSKEYTMWGNRTLVFECPKSRRPYEDWLDLIYLPFEFIEVPVPRKYDEMLRQQYGDYMKIPENKGGNMHGDLIISTDLPYDKYKESLK